MNYAYQEGFDEGYRKGYEDGMNALQERMVLNTIKNFDNDSMARINIAMDKHAPAIIEVDK